ncbi:manganese/zinc/iron transport system permease protein [Alkalispirochaeta americana]|uniref:Manganese/zinc/iron transport system permease protein n=1 Tax=Alkalispirochaeta americana TaxID=159291 RepID=A0A1N6VYR8_9SPIO|nr:metal ABC transporter permease [Alkalispirochaeta americana]SIQ83027.1 manganese/zinc/iron transport system permease protein [Alkalispirochaeta americana]
MYLDHTLLIVLSGSGLAGALAGAVGCFTYLRKEGLLGGIVAHSSLLGITGAFLLGSLLGGAGLAEQLILPGALLGGITSMIFVSLVTQATPVKPDTAMGVTVALFFGGGLFLLRILQSLALPGHRVLRDYLFGQAATITRQETLILLILTCLVATALFLFWKELKLHSFDPHFLVSSGYPSRVLNHLLILIVVIAVIAGLRTMGVILMVSLLVSPAAAARQWTKRLGTMMGLAALLGALAGVTGTLLSATARNIPTGPVIALAATVFALASILVAPRRGILARSIQQHRNRQHFSSSPGPDSPGRTRGHPERTPGARR